MKAATSAASKTRGKAPTGIAGFDAITGGGLPGGRTTLMVGAPGSGKTVFALHFLVHGARACREPGLFVAFEETSGRIVANAASFGWKLAQLRPGKLFFVDAPPEPDLVQSGDFDLRGMLAALESKARDIGARRIVFDALDIALDLLPDMAARRREIHRLHDWLLAREMTGLITLKTGCDDAADTGRQAFRFMEFMVDCVVVLNHSMVQGISQRNLRVQKYRGSGFDENESAFLIGKSGFEVAVARAPGRVDTPISHERVSSGIARLDTMLGGGYYRGASVLITGSPGTAKTTLGGAFAEAACRRGERALFVSFDSDGTEVLRDLASVGIRLARYLKSGRLRIISARNITGSAETYLVRIRMLAKEQGARCLVIDPMSTLSKAGNELTAHSVAERLIDWSKAEGITLVCTCLFEEASGLKEGRAPLRLSTLSDTWIHLNHVVQAGERNRGLSIIKSRGTAHSNQVRELILSDAGVNLTDAYTAGGEVLMGTMRWEKESAERAASEGREVALKLKRDRLDAEEAELAVRMKSLQVELAAKRMEKAMLVRSTRSREENQSKGRTRMRELRGADAARPVRK